MQALEFLGNRTFTLEVIQNSIALINQFISRNHNWQKTTQIQYYSPWTIEPAERTRRQMYKINFRRLHFFNSQARVYHFCAVFLICFSYNFFYIFFCLLSLSSPDADKQNQSNPRPSTPASPCRASEGETKKTRNWKLNIITDSNKRHQPRQQLSLLSLEFSHSNDNCEKSPLTNKPTSEEWRRRTNTGRRPFQEIHYFRLVTKAAESFRLKRKQPTTTKKRWWRRFKPTCRRQTEPTRAFTVGHTSHHTMSWSQSHFKEVRDALICSTRCKFKCQSN